VTINMNPTTLSENDMYSEKVLFFSDPDGNPAGKTFIPNDAGGFTVKSSYSMPTLLRPREASVRDARSFFAAVKKATKHGEFLVHGVRKRGAQLNAEGLMFRRKNGEDATVREVERHGWAVDVDMNAGSPLHAALADRKVDVFGDIVTAVKAVAELALPAWLRAGPLMWHASGSCGLIDHSFARFHFFCWLDRSISPGIMKALIRSHNADLQAQGLSNSAHSPCDTSLYQGVQPVYLGVTFEGGMDDPLPARFGVIKSKRLCSRAPDIKLIPQSGKKNARTAVRSGKGGFEPLVEKITWPGQINECLALIGDGHDHLGFHRPLLHITYRMACNALRDGKRCTEVWVTQNVETLRQVIDEAPSDDRTAEQIEHYKAEVERYLIEGYEKANARQREQAALAQRVGPLYPEPGLPLKKAEATMKLEIEQFVDDALTWGHGNESQRPPRVTVAASPGLGKSHATMLAILELVDLTAHRVIAVVPTHTLAEEWASRCAKLAAELKMTLPAIRTVKGRNRPGMCEPPADQRKAIKDTIQAAVKLGVSVRQSACQAFDRKPTCPYLQQWQDHGPGLMVVPQAYFRNGAIPGVSDRDAEGAAPISLVVIDESITNALTRQQSVLVETLAVGLPDQGTSGLGSAGPQKLVGVRSVKVSAIINCRALNKVRSDEEFVHETTRAVGSLLSSRCELPMEAVVQAFKEQPNGQTWARCAVERFMVAEKTLAFQVQKQMRHAVPKNQFDHVSSDMRRRLDVIRWMVGFLELLDHHAKTPERGRLVGIRTNKVRVKRAGKARTVRYAELNYFGKMPEFAIKHPLLMLDATAEPEIVKLTMARSPRSKEKVISIRAEAKHAKLTLVQGAKIRMGELAPKDLNDSQRLPSDHPIERLHALLWMLDKHSRRPKRSGSVGLITYKKTCAYFDRHGLLTDVPKMHFGALRGLNAMQGVSTLIIAGRLWPNEEDLLNQTEALLAFDAKGRESGDSMLGSSLRGVRMRGGGCEVLTQTEHACQMENLILGGVIDAEVVQALGRARALRRTSENPVHILLLADRVIDATFDEVVQVDAVLPSAHTAMLIGQGAAPTKAKAAWHMGKGLFSSLAQAQGWAEGMGKTDNAGEEYWRETLNKPMPKSKTVKLPELHTQPFKYLGGLKRKFYRIFGVEPDGKTNGINLYRCIHDASDLDAPVLEDKRSPGSQITRRRALELWEKEQTQAGFAKALGRQLGQPVNRASARTILRKLKPFMPTV
jgi:hypothetical protein